MPSTTVVATRQTATAATRRYPMLRPTTKTTDRRTCTPECGDLERCLDEVCIDVRDAPCTLDDDCGSGGVCGLGATCTSQTPAATARFVDQSHTLAPLWPTNWFFTAAERDPIGYGGSAAFFEGPENSLGLLVAGTSDASNNLCLFTFAAGIWSVDSGLCDSPTTNVNVVAYLPPHAGIPARFVLGGTGTVTVTDAALENPIELLVLPEGDPIAGCGSSVLLPIDVDSDGILDIVLSCHGRLGLTSTSTRTRLFRGLDDGTFEDMPDRFATEFENSIFLLAIGTHDLNGDGLLDHLLVVDTFSNPERRNTTRTPGYFLRRCSPLEDCVWEPRVFAAGTAAYTSHMGISQIDVDTIGSLFVLSDWGPRDFLSMTTNPPTDFEPLLRIGLGYDASEDEYLYSWSHVVADLDRNGLPDMFSTQGSAEYRRVRFSYQPEHQDLIFLQQGGGRFTVVDEYEWLVLPEGETRAPFRSEYSRAAVELDLDLDGLLDIYISRFGRSPMLLEELDQGHEPRCTLRFNPRYVPSTGSAFAVAATIGGPYATTTVQGDMRIQRPLRATVAHREGWVRFPSGAVVPYTCGTSNGPIDVTEPDWLAIERADSRLFLSIDRAAWPTEIRSVDVAFVDAERTRIGTATLDDTFSVTDPVVATADAIMVRINDRWVDRYFALPQE
jgi:hypothetical protein